MAHQASENEQGSALTENAACLLLILLSWFNLPGLMSSEETELDFIEKVYLTIRASCFASIPLLANMLVIPIFILIVEKFQNQMKMLIEDKASYHKFIDTNISLIKDHFQMLLLFEINLFGLAVLEANKLQRFRERCIIIASIFFLSRFLHIYQKIVRSYNSSEDPKEMGGIRPTLGQNLILQLNFFLFLTNFCKIYAY
mmetsp:Transcript_8523/g.14369  ORF Transcript_8523/g.14369 Transcript_8523/m.14369 type:complete len:199 (-) Transcript_8523:12-608(-)